MLKLLNIDITVEEEEEEAPIAQMVLIRGHIFLISWMMVVDVTKAMYLT